MSEQAMRDQFAAQARNLKEFKHLQFHRFANGEFAELMAEAAFIGYRMGVEVSNGH